MARTAGFEVPETVVLDCSGQDVAWPDRLFPAVLKPHRSVVAVAWSSKVMIPVFRLPNESVNVLNWVTLPPVVRKITD